MNPTMLQTLVKKKNTKRQPDQVINWSQPLPPKTGLIRPEKKERRQKASDKPHNLAREKKETLSAEEKGKENSSPLHLKTTIPQLDYEEKGKNQASQKQFYPFQKNCGQF